MFSKQNAIQLMAGYVLEYGLAAASLRPLAKAVGSSDRMLIYHFGTKDQLMAEVLQYLAELLQSMLDSALPDKKPKSLKETLTNMQSLLRLEPSQQFFKLWLDIVAQASRGEEIYRHTGGAMIGSYIGWLKNHLPENTQNPDKVAALLLTLIEGMVVMDAVGRNDLSDQAIETFEQLLEN